MKDELCTKLTRKTDCIDGIVAGCPFLLRTRKRKETSARVLGTEYIEIEFIGSSDTLY